MRIGVLTGGGDVPGLNPCIKAIANRANDNGWEALGIRLGWAGLLNYNPDDDEESRRRWIMPLTRASVRTIDRFGGTHLHTSRTNPQKLPRQDLPAFLESSFPNPAMASVDGTAHVLRVLRHLGIEALISIGGDGTLTFAARLHQEGVKIIAIPKTMDNDVFGTDYCIGFSTAVTRSVEAIHALRSTAGSHERILIVELFGRNSGETALVSAYLADADRALISEVPVDVENLARLLMDDRERNPSHYAVVVVSEGATLMGGRVVEYGEADAYGRRKLGGIGEVLGAALKQLTGVEYMQQQLAYLMRAGAPDALDRMVAVTYGNLAVQQIEQRQFGVMLALRHGLYTTVPVGTCMQGVKRVDVSELYDAEGYRPKVKHVLGKPLFLY